jgi:hypothetical protein
MAEGRFPTFKQTNVGPVLDRLRSMMSHVEAPALPTPTLPSASLVKGMSLKLVAPAMRYMKTVGAMPSAAMTAAPQMQRTVTKALRAQLTRGSARNTAKVGVGALALHMGSTAVQQVVTAPSVLAALSSVAQAMIASAGNAGGYAAATAAVAGQLAGSAGVAATAPFIQAGAAAIVSETSAITLLSSLIAMAPVVIPLLVAAMVAQIPVQKRTTGPDYQRLEYDEEYDPFAPGTAKPRVPKPVPLPPTPPPAPKPSPAVRSTPAAAPSVTSKLSSFMSRLVEPVAVKVRQLTLPAFEPGKGTKRKVNETSLKQYTDQLKRVRISSETELKVVTKRTLALMKDRVSVRERASERRATMRTRALESRKSAKQAAAKRAAFERHQARRAADAEQERLLIGLRMMRKRRATQEAEREARRRDLDAHKSETQRRAAADQVIIERNWKRQRATAAAYERSFPLKAPPEAAPTKSRVPTQKAKGKTRRPTRKQLLRASRRLKL